MSYKKILEGMIKTAMSGPLSDIESGSVMRALLKIETQERVSRLVRFLTKLDGRFRKFQP